jgi:MFS transporter, MHS family, citrate/tricarballylate:H+ symporter
MQEKRNSYALMLSPAGPSGTGDETMTQMAEAHASVPARHVVAVVVGNALEFYDFLTYAFFAVYIGRAFFPSASPAASLLASLGTFGVGFVTRPIGGFVIGRMGDRLGRKPAMIFSFSLMGIAIAGLALTPPHSMIGVAAPVLVVFFRMLQGFALGGEVGPTTAFLLEAAPPERRGFYTAFQYWTQDLSVLISGLVGFGLANALSEQQLQDFGWRIAFLVGAAIVPFGLMLRRSLPETFHARDGGKRERISLRPYLWVVVLGLLLLANGTIATYTTDYMTTYAIATLHMHTNVAFAATVVVGLSGVVFDLMSGALSDRIGRKPTMLLFGVPLLVSILPSFYLISHYRTTATLLGATAVMSSLVAMSTCPVIIWLTEGFPAAIRSSSVAVVYAISIATFGGSTQYAITWLIRATGNPLAPAWYWTAAAIVGVIAMTATHESAPRKLAKREALLVPLPNKSVQKRLGELAD